MDILKTFGLKPLKVNKNTFSVQSFHGRVDTVQKSHSAECHSAKCHSTGKPNVTIVLSSRFKLVWCNIVTTRNKQSPKCGWKCRGCQTITRELVTLAYFSACWPQVTRVSTCVGDRRTPPTDWRSRQDINVNKCKHN